MGNRDSRRLAPVTIASRARATEGGGGKPSRDSSLPITAFNNIRQYMSYKIARLDCPASRCSLLLSRILGLRRKRQHSHGHRSSLSHLRPSAWTDVKPVRPIELAQLIWYSRPRNLPLTRNAPSKDICSHRPARKDHTDVPVPFRASTCSSSQTRYWD
jgi:hypothetical protein